MGFHDGSLLHHILLPELLDALTQHFCHSRQRVFGLVLLRFFVFRLIVDQVAVQILACEHDLAHSDTRDDAFATNSF